MIVDLTKFNQEELWAIQWGVQTANESLKYQIDYANSQNEQITKDNEKLLPEHKKPLVTVPELYTAQTWIDFKLKELVSGQLSMFQSQVRQNVEKSISALSLEERLQLMASLNVEPVLKS